MAALVCVALIGGSAAAQDFPAPAVYPLNVQIGSSYQSVTVGGVCTAGGCTTPTSVPIQATISGGTPPYTVVVKSNGQVVNTGSAGYSGFYEYDFTPSTPNTYSIEVQVTDSASPPNTYSAFETVTGLPQTGSESGVNSASLSTTSATVNVGQGFPITLTIPGGGTTAYTVSVLVNGNTMATTTTYSTYTYTITPPTTGQYIVEFEVSDNFGNSAVETATVTATLGGGSSGGSSSGTLAIAVSPTYKSVAPGTPVSITATATGGNSAIYNIVLNDGNGNQVASSQTGTLSATYTPYQSGTYYPLTAIVYDASHNVAQQTIYLQTTQSTASSPGALSETVTPSSGATSTGSSTQFTVTPSGGLAPYYLTVRDQYNNLLLSPPALQNTNPYPYTITEAAPGTYTFTFTLEDSLGRTATQSATLTVSSGGGAAGITSPSPSSSGGLSVSVTPPGVTTAPSGSTVQISATASGGNSAIYNIVLNNGSGSELAASQTGTLSYTYSVPSAPGYYPLTALVYDASHNVAQQTIYVQVPG